MNYEISDYPMKFTTLQASNDIIKIKSILEMARKRPIHFRIPELEYFNLVKIPIPQNGLFFMSMDSCWKDKKNDTSLA